MLTDPIGGSDGCKRYEYAITILEQLAILRTQGPRRVVLRPWIDPAQLVRVRAVVPLRDDTIEAVRSHAADAAPMRLVLHGGARWLVDDALGDASDGTVIG